MFKIGEFSRLVRVSARMLRYYDQCGLLRPAEIDRFTGYRLYSVAQMPHIARIVALRDAGFGVEEIEEILPHYGEAAYMQRALDEKSIAISTAIAAEQDKLNRIAAMRGGLGKERDDMIYEAEVKKLNAVTVLSLQEVIPAFDREGDLWEKLGAYIAQNGIPCGEGGYSIYHDEEYKERDVNVEIAVPVPELKEAVSPFRYKVLPAMPMAATIRFSGPYQNYTPAIEKLAAWIEENGYAFDGLIRGHAIHMAKDERDMENNLIELQVPVRKA